MLKTGFAHIPTEPEQPATPHASDPALQISSLLPAILLFLPLCVPLATGRVFAIDDLAVWHLPLRVLYADALSQGASILWTPSMFNGFFLHGEGQLGALHPLHLLMFRLLPVAIGFNLELILSYVAAFCGMYVFLRRIGLSSPASSVGATAFAFSGFNLLRLSQMNMVAVAAHLPWLLVSLETVLTGSARARALGFAAISMLVGSQIMLGHPQTVWMSSLTCTVYALARLSRGIPASRAGVAAVAAVVGVAIGGAQLLPTFEYVSNSLRATVPLEFSLSFSLHPFNLVQLCSPYIFRERVYALPGEHFVHEFVAYSGSLCTVAFLWAIVRNRRLPLRHIALFGFALSIVGVLLALGRYGFVYELVAALPVVGKFRGSARHVLLLHVGLSILLAICYEDLIRLGRQGKALVRRSWISIPVGVSAVTAVGVWLGRDVFPLAGAELLSVRGAMVGVVLSGVAGLLVSDAARGARAALLILPLYGAFDLGLSGYPFIWSDPPHTIEALAARAELPASAAFGTTVHIPDSDARRNLVLLRGARLSWAYVGVYPSRALPPDNRTVQRLGGVEFVNRGSGWERVHDRMPRVRVVADALVSTTPLQELQKIDVSRTALVSRQIAPLQSQGRYTAIVSADSPGRLDVDITATGRALLVTTESYHADWVASADGRELVTTALFGDYLGVVLEPGAYRVSLRFSSRAARLGIILSLAGLVVAVAGALVVRRTH